MSTVLPAPGLRGRVICISIGITIVLVAVFANRLGLSSHSGFGTAKLMLVLIGACSFLAGALPPKSKIRQAYYRILLAGCSGYLALVVAEVLIHRSPQSGRNWRKDLVGMCRAADIVGFDYTPHWHGFFDDGVVRCEIHINSLGARDDEPLPAQAEVRRVLLIGDSFAFGHCLDQSETIDKYIERISEGTHDAYNLGVGGYGSGETLERFRLATWWTGSDVFYLFFHNDLRRDNSEVGLHTVFEGHLVPKYRPDGTPYSDDDYRQRMPANELKATATVSPVARIKELVQLTAIRRRIRLVVGSDSELLDGDPQDYHPEFVRSAIDNTRRMEELAGERGFRFHVVIIPSKGETFCRRYASFTDSYVNGVKEAGINVLELKDRFSTRHYFEHDGHLNSAGAKLTATVILEAFQEQ